MRGLSPNAHKHDANAQKANEEARRNEGRDKARKAALKAHAEGDYAERWKRASAAVRINRNMVTEFIRLCVDMKVHFVCAPYEGLLCF